MRICFSVRNFPYNDHGLDSRDLRSSIYHALKRKEKIGMFHCLFTITTKALNNSSTGENHISVSQELSQNLSRSFALVTLSKFLSRSKNALSQKANVQQVLTGMAGRPSDSNGRWGCRS